jgi:hypothetical protein
MVAKIGAYLKETETGGGLLVDRGGYVYMCIYL